MADSQFTRLLQIDPSAYEGPSTFEGLGDFLGAVNQYNQQSKAEARYQDSLAKEEERYQDSLAAQKEAIALEQERHDDEGARGEQRYESDVNREDSRNKILDARYTAEQKRIIKDKEDASRNAFYEKAVRDYGNSPLELSLYLESSGRFDGVNPDSGAEYADEFNLARLKKQGKAYNKLSSHLDAMTDPEQTTKEEALDFLDTTDFSTAGVYGDKLRQRAENMITKRDAWFSQQLKNPFVEMQIKEIYNKYSVANQGDQAAPRVLTEEGQARLKAVYDGIRGTGAYEISYIGGLPKGSQGPMRPWGEPTRKGTYLYEGVTVAPLSTASPVDDEGELTEEASVVATNIADSIANGDPIENVLENSLNASEVVDPEGIKTKASISNFLYSGNAGEVVDDDRRIGEPFTGDTLPLPMRERQQPIMYKTKALISKEYSGLPRSGKLVGSNVAKFIKDLGVSPSEIPTNKDLDKIVDFSLKNFGENLRKVGKQKVSVFNRGKLKDIQNYFYSLEQAAKDGIDRDTKKDKEARKAEVDSIYAKHINRLESVSGLYRDPPGFGGVRTRDTRAIGFPGY